MVKENFQKNILKDFDKTFKFSFFISLLLFFASCNPTVEKEGEAAATRNIKDTFTVSIKDGSITSEETNPVIQVVGSFLIGDTIHLYEDSSCQTLSTTKTATSRTINEITASSLILKGTYRFHIRTETRTGLLSPCSSDGALYNFILDYTADAPTIIQQQAPNYRDLQIKAQGVEADSVAKFYEGADCVEANYVGEATANSFGIATLTLTDVSKTTHSYSVKNSVSGIYVGCSEESESITITSKPTTLELAPGYASPSNHPFPRINVKGLIPGYDVKIYDDSTCSGAALDQVTASQTVETLIGIVLTQGVLTTDTVTQQFYAEHDGECSDTSLTYYFKPTPQNLAADFSSTSTQDYHPVVSASNLFDKDSLTLTTTLELFVDDTTCSGTADNSILVTSSIGELHTTNNLTTQGTTTYSMRQIITGNTPHSGSFQKGVNITTNCSSSASLTVDFTPVVNFKGTLTSPSSNPFPSFEITNLQQGSTIDIYSDSTCTTSVPATINQGTTTAEITIDNPQNVGSTETYYIGQTPPDISSEFCSSAIVYKVEGTQLSLALKDGIATADSETDIGFKAFNKINGSTISIYTNTTSASATALADCNGDTNAISCPFTDSGSGYFECDAPTLTSDESYIYYFRETHAGSGYDSGCLEQSIYYKLDRQPKDFSITTESNTDSLQPEFKVRNILDGATVYLYTDGSCSAGETPISSASYSVIDGYVHFQLPSEVSNDGVLIYSTKQDLGGTKSVCSNSTSFAVNATPKVARSFNTSSVGDNVTPTFRVSGLLTNGSRTVNLYKSTDCTGGAIASQINSSNDSYMDFTLDFGELTSDGVYYFSANQSLDNPANLSDCSAVIASYQLDGRLKNIGLAPGTFTPSKIDLTPTIRVSEPLTLSGIDTNVELYSSQDCDPGTLVVTSTQITKGEYNIDVDIPSLTADGSYTYWGINILDDGLGNVYRSNCSVAKVEYVLDGRPTQFYRQLSYEYSDITPVFGIDDNYYDPDEFDASTTVEFFLDAGCNEPVPDVAAVYPTYDSIGGYAETVFVTPLPATTLANSGTTQIIDSYTHRYTFQDGSGGSIFPGDGVFPIYAKVSRGTYTSDCSNRTGNIIIETTPRLSLHSSMSQPITTGTPLLTVANVFDGEVNIYFYDQNTSVPTEVITQVITQGTVVSTQAITQEIPCDKTPDQVVSYIGTSQSFDFSLDPGLITANTSQGQTYKIFAGRNDPNGSFFDDKNGCSAQLDIEVSLPSGIRITSDNPGNSLTPTFEVDTVTPNQNIAIFMGENPCLDLASATQVSSQGLTTTQGTISLTISQDNLMNSDDEFLFWAMIFEGTVGSPTFQSCSPADPEELKYTLIGAPKSTPSTTDNDTTPQFLVSGYDPNATGIELHLFNDLDKCEDATQTANVTQAISAATQAITWTTDLTADGSYDFYVRVRLPRSGPFSDYVSNCDSFNYILDTRPTNINIASQTILTDNDFSPPVELSNLIVGESIIFYKDDATCTNAADALATFTIASVTETFDVDLSNEATSPTTDDTQYIIYAKQTTPAPGVSDCSSGVDYTLNGMPSVDIANDPPTPYSDPTPDMEITNLHVETSQSILLYRDDSGTDGCINLIASQSVSSATQTVTVTTPLPSSGTFIIRAKQINSSGYDSPCSDDNNSFEYELDLTNSDIAVTDSTMLINPVVSILNTIDSDDDPTATVDVYSDNCTQSVAQSSPTSTSNSGITAVPLFLEVDGTHEFKYTQSATGVTPTCSSASTTYNLNAAPIAETIASSAGDPEPSLTWNNIITPISTDEVVLNIYNDSSCSQFITSETFDITLASTTASIVLTDTLTQDGNYTFYADQDYIRISGGPNFDSNCSASSLNFNLDGSPQNITRTSSADILNPEFSMDNLLTGTTVTTYPSLSDCTQAINAMSTTVSQSGNAATVVIDLTSENDGDYEFNFNQTKSLGTNTYISSCNSINYTLNRAPQNITHTSGLLRPTFSADVLVSTDGSLHLYTDLTDCQSDTSITQDLEIGIDPVSAATSQSFSVSQGSEFLKDGTYTLYLKQISAGGIHSSCSSFDYTIDGRVTSSHGLDIDSSQSITAPDFLLTTTQALWDNSGVSAYATQQVKVYHVPIGINPATKDSKCTGSQVKAVGLGDVGTEGDNSTRVVQLDLSPVTDTTTDFYFYATTYYDFGGGRVYESKCSVASKSYSIDFVPGISSSDTEGASATIDVNLTNIGASGDVVEFYETDDCSGAPLDSITVTQAPSDSGTITISNHGSYSDGNTIFIYAKQVADSNPYGFESGCTSPTDRLSYTVNATPVINEASYYNFSTNLDIKPYYVERPITFTGANTWLQDGASLRVYLSKDGSICDQGGTSFKKFYLSALTTGNINSSVIDFDGAGGCSSNTLSLCQGEFTVSILQDIDSPYNDFNSPGISICYEADQKMVVDFKPQIFFDDNDDTELEGTDPQPIFYLKNTITGANGVELYRSAGCDPSSLQALTQNTDSDPNDGTYNIIQATQLITTPGTYYFSAKVKRAGSFTSDCSDPILYDFSGLTVSMVTSSPNSDMTPLVSVGNLSSQDIVTLYRDADCQYPISTVQTNDAGDPIVFNSSQLPFTGTHEFHATRKINGVGQETVCSVSSASYELVVEPTSITLTSGLSSVDTDRTPTINVTGVLDDATIKVYYDNACENLIATATTVTGQTSRDITVNSLPGAGQYEFHITQHKTGFDSGCSSIGVSYEYLDRPTDVQTLTHSPGGTDTPTIRVFGVANNSVVNLYNNSSCIAGASDVNLMGSVVSTGTFADVPVSSGKITAEGQYSFFANHTTNNGAGTTSNCSSISSDYTYRTTKQIWTLNTNVTNDIDLTKFGKAVAIMGDIAVVGAPGDTTNNPTTNEAYVFRNNGTQWIKEKELASSNGITPDARDEFGYSVAISETKEFIIVGAPGFSSDKGKVYVFKNNSGSWDFVNAFTKSVLILDSVSVGSSSDRFGHSVAIDDVDDVAFVGVPGHDFSGATDSGAVIKVTGIGTGTTAQEFVKLNPLTDSSVTINDQGKWDSGTNTPDITQSPIAGYIYLSTDNNSSTAIGQVVREGDYVYYDGSQWIVYNHSGFEIGKNLSIAGDNLIVGADGDDSFYVFNKDNIMNVSIKYAHSSTGIQFGADVDIDGSNTTQMIIVGAPQFNSGEGKAFLFNVDTGQTPFVVSQDVVMPEISPLTPDSAGLFGASVAIDDESGRNALIGAPGAASGRGTVYSFGGLYYSLEAAIIPYDIVSDPDALGTSVDTQGDKYIFGAPEVNGSGDGQGRAYFYHPN